MGGSLTRDRGLTAPPTPSRGTVQYVHLMEEAKAILRGLIPGNTLRLGISQS